ncbi:MAG: alpha-ribazole-5-phosphate synthase [Eubacteriaceae bacterium]
MKTYLYRDLSIIEFPDFLLISACDSTGGVGEKPGDSLKVPTKYIGMFATRVCLFELLCCGGEIIGISNTVACEMEPTGKAMINGIEEELGKAGLLGLPINGSTEENFSTTMTGFGVFVLAKAPKLRVTKSVSGDCVICIGKPKFGGDLILENDPEIASYEDLNFLINCDGVNEIVPCGSKGILFEAKNLGSLYHLDFVPQKNPLNIESSSGPSTTVIASISPPYLSSLTKHFGSKLTVIGQFKDVQTTT